MDRLESMSILVTAAEAGSLSAAARRLGIPLTTVSRKVSELEAHLKTTLLNRSSRRLTLTDAGRSYVADCKRILEDVGEAERAASGEYSAPKGDLIITAPIVFGRLHVLPVITAFLKAYPDIDIRIVLADRIGEPPGRPCRSRRPDRRAARQQLGCDPSRHDSPRCMRQPGLFRRARHAEESGRTSTHDCITFEGLMSPDTWTFTHGQVRDVCRHSLATCRQHSRSGH